MTVDVSSRQSDGRRQLTLGPVEWWIVAAAGAAILTGGWKFTDSMTSRLDRQNDAIAQLATQQAVTSGQITTLTAQLADIPAMRTTVTEVKLRVERHEQDIKEIRANRGLR